MKCETSVLIINCHYNVNVYVLRIALIQYNTIAFTSGLSSRDLSPVDLVREYWSDCKDEVVEDMERIYVRMSNAADRGVDMVQRTAKEGVDIVKRKVEGGVDIVKRTAKGGVEIAKAAKEVPQKMIRKVRHYQHCSFGGLPDWMKDNEYLQVGHRPELNSFKECFKSW